MGNQQDACIGKVFGEYRLLRRLGGGAFGTVYQAEHLHHHMPAAVKVLRVQLTRPEDFKGFINEARLIRFQHPHIVSLLDFGVNRDDVSYLVMEYASGGTLRDRHPQGTRPSLPTLLRYVEQLASALQYAHEQRMVHRDVKPENMLLRGDGTLLLSDFGIAKVLESHSLVSMPSALGTPAYMAPEQSQGKPCAASDQYALAVVVYEWLTGQRPFQGSALEVALQHRLDPPPALTDLAPELPAGAEQVVLKALAKDPAARFVTVPAFATALRNALQMPPSMTGPVQVVLPATAHASEAASVLFAENLVQRSGPVEPAVARNIPALLAQPARSSSPQASSEVSAPSHLALRQKPSIPATTTPPIPVIQRHRLSRRLLFFSTIALLVIIASLGAFSLMHGPSQGLSASDLTATASVFAASSTFQTTSSAAVQAYNTAVARNGIQGGFDAGHSGYNPYEQQLSPTTVPHLKQAWTASTNRGITFSPVVANGVVYLGDGSLYAYKADGCGQASCEPLWTAAPTHGVMDASPAVANGMVYLTEDGNGHQVQLHAFKATGCGQSVCKPLWTASMVSYFLSSPTVAHGVVYVMANDMVYGYSRLYAFTAEGCGQPSCSPLWSAPAGTEATSSPAVANGVAYVSSGDGTLYAFNANGCGQASCAPLWTAPGSGSYTSLVVVNGVVYVSSSVGNQGKLSAFKAAGCGQASCSPLWTIAVNGEMDTRPAVANGMIYVTSDASGVGMLSAFKAAGCGQSSCPPLWTAPLGNNLQSAPVVANGVVYVSSSRVGIPGTLQLSAFKAAGCGQSSCTPLWTAPHANAPVIANGFVYAGSYDNNQLYAFHL